VKSLCWSSVCSVMALSLPPLQQKRMGSGVVICIFSDQLKHATKLVPTAKR